MAELVKGSRRPQPILRKYRQPLYDEEKVGNGVAPTTIPFFTKPRGQQDNAGVTKTERDTNSQAANQLGALQEFYLVGFTLNIDLSLKVVDVPVHTDPGLLHLSRIQNGAPAGQDITLTVGGLGVAAAYNDGYVVNVTEGNCYAIATHTDTVLTMVGALTGWTDSDVLEIYSKYWGNAGEATNPVEIIKRIFSDSVFTYTFGRQQPLTEVPTDRIPWGVGPQGSIFHRSIVPAVGCVSSLITSGVPSVREFHDVRLRKARPRHIQPDQSFQGEIKWPRSPGVILASGLWARIMCYQIGILLSSI